jgi:hypothetical protein
MWVSGQRHAPAALYPGERTPGTHCTGSWVGLRAGLDTEVRGKKNPLPLPGIEPRTKCTRAVLLMYSIWFEVWNAPDDNQQAPHKPSAGWYRQTPARCVKCDCFQTRRKNYLVIHVFPLCTGIIKQAPLPSPVPPPVPLAIQTF